MRRLLCAFVCTPGRWLCDIENPGSPLRHPGPIPGYSAVKGSRAMLRARLLDTGDWR